MITEYTVKKYCCEDLSLIENYDKAIADTIQHWECHHRRGTIYSKSGLIEIDEYYNRPAIELIFMPSKEHKALHTKLKMTGYKHTKESREKMSIAHLGKKRGPHSEDHKRKLSEAHKGKKLSSDTRNKISNTLKGFKQSPDTVAKKYHKTAQYTLDGKLIKIWLSAKDASRELGINQGNLCSCCRGIKKSAGGYVWKYVSGGN